MFDDYRSHDWMKSKGILYFDHSALNHLLSINQSLIYVLLVMNRYWIVRIAQELEHLFSFQSDFFEFKCEDWFVRMGDYHVIF